MSRQFKPGQLQTGSLYDITSSFALTASYAVNTSTTIDTGSFVTTSSFNSFTSSYAQTSASFSSSITSLTAATSSYILASQTSSMTVLSSSFALTASYATAALSASYAPDTTFPYTGSARITGSLSVTGSFIVSSSIGNLISLSTSGLVFNGPGGTAFTPSIDFRRNGSSVFYIDEYATKFNNDAYFNTIRSYGVASISVLAQSGGAGQYIYLHPASSAISLGFTTASARLDIKAQGALSTDIAFRVRNSADTANILTVNGDNSARLGSDATSGGKLTIAAANTSVLNLDTSYSTDTATISVARRITPTYNTNAFLFTHNSFSDGNVQPYKFHFVNPSTYWDYTEAGWVPIYDAGFMWFKDSATAPNLQMKLTPDNALQFYTSSRVWNTTSNAAPLQTYVSGGFQIYASGSAGQTIPYIRTENGTLLWLGNQTRLYTVTASVVSASFIGNLTGTASYATTAETASYILPLQQTVVLTGSLNVTGSTTQVGNNTLLGNTTLSGSIIISGSQGISNPTVKVYGDITHDGYIRFNPVSTNIDTSISASYIYVSGSTNDLYFTQNGNGYANTTRLRWLEGNLYTGLLNGGRITATTGSTTFNVGSGSGIIVDLNASLNDNPYPTIQYVNWPTYTAQTLTYLTSSIQTYIGIDGSGNILQQTTPYINGEYNTKILLGTVLHQNQSTINGSITYPNVAYGYKQRTYDFIKAFGPLKLSGLNIIPSSSLGLTVGSGTAFADGRNYQVDPDNPSYITDPGTNISKIFRYYQSGSSFVQDTNGGVGYTVIDPANYNPGGSGSLQPVPGTGINREWSVQRVFWYPNSATKGIVVYYGSQTYANEIDAAANISYELFQEVENTKQNAVYLGAIVIRNNGNFTDSTSYRLLPAGIFRNVGGSGGGGNITSLLLSQLGDVSISGPTNGQPLVYNSSSLKWENSSALTANLSGNASTATSASYAQTASYVQTAQTASYVLQAVSSSYTPIVIGSTALTSGTSGRLLLQSGSVIQQDSEIFWDLANKKLGIGKSPAASSAKAVIAITDGTGNQNYWLTLRNTAAGYGSWGFVKLASNDLGITYQTDVDTPNAGTSLRLYYGGNSAFASSLSVGNLSTPSARLDVRAQGALSTDVAFRVRNSADSFNLLSIDGVGLISGRTDGAGGFNMNYQGTANTTVQLTFNNGNPTLRVAQNTGGHAFNVYTSTDNREYLAGLIGKATFAIGANPLGGTIKPNEANTNTMYVFNGTAPTLSATDSFNLYSADVVAGNAAPHFRTEAGNVVKLYTQNAVSSSQGLADALTNLGLLTGSSTIVTPSTFPYTGSAQITGSLIINNALSTAVSNLVNTGTTTLYAFATASYDGVFVDYTARSGSNARAGQLMGIWDSTSVNFTETTTTDFGSTDGLTLGMNISSSAIIVSASATTNGWTIKTIIRSI